MKFEFIIEDLVPRRREVTIDIPDEEDDPAEYLREHPELWRDPRQAANIPDIVGMRLATPPQTLTPDTPLMLEWTTFVKNRHQSTVTVGELHRALTQGSGNPSIRPFLAVLDATGATVGNAVITGLDPWLNDLETTGATTVESQVADRIVEPVALATDRDIIPPPPGRPAIPGEHDRVVTFEFTEYARGTGTLALAMLADEGLWEPGEPVTEATLAEYFGRHGTDPGQSTDAETSFGGIGFTDLSRQAR